MMAPLQVEPKSEIRRSVPACNLVIGTTHSRLERDADRRAERALQSSRNDGRAAVRHPVQSETAEPASLPVASSVARTLSDGGAPLEQGQKRDMEQRFGTDFSDVRIHRSASAARSASDMNARAYTLGSHIVFGERESPSNPGLIAHELAHVVQARTMGQPVILRQEGKDGPTFGNLPRSDPIPAVRLRLVKENGKWYEIHSDLRGTRRPAAGSYKFVVQDGVIWAVKPRSTDLGVTGHTEAAAGGRVSFAGRIHFSQKGHAITDWDAGSGHYRPPRISAEAAMRGAGLSTDELAKFDPKAVDVEHAEEVKKAQKKGYEPPRKQGALPTYQPPKEQVLEPRGRGGDVKRIGADKPEAVPQKTVVHGEITAKPVPAAPVPPQAASLDPEPAGGAATAPHATSTAAKSAMKTLAAEQMAKSMAFAQEAENFRARVQTYFKAYSAYTSFKAVLTGLETAQTVYRTGHALPENIRVASALIVESQEAIDRVNSTYVAPSLDTLMQLYALEDAPSLSKIAGTYGSFSTAERGIAKQLAAMSGQAKKFSDEAMTSAIATALELVQAREETASAATAVFVSEDLKTIGYDLRVAAENYASAARQAFRWADDAEFRANLANDMLLKGFKSLTPRCDFLNQNCEEEKRALELAREAGRMMLGSGADQ